MKDRIITVGCQLPVLQRALTACSGFLFLDHKVHVVDFVALADSSLGGGSSEMACAFFLVPHDDPAGVTDELMGLGHPSACGPKAHRALARAYLGRVRIDTAEKVRETAAILAWSFQHLDGRLLMIWYEGAKGHASKWDWTAKFGHVDGPGESRALLPCSI